MLESRLLRLLLVSLLALFHLASSQTVISDGVPTDFQVLRKGEVADFVIKVLDLGTDPANLVMFSLGSFSGDCDAVIGLQPQATDKLWELVSGIPEVLEVTRGDPKFQNRKDYYVRVFSAGPACAYTFLYSVMIDQECMSLLLHIRRFHAGRAESHGFRRFPQRSTLWC